ncbi:MAG: hypothetical protein ACYS32_10790, partial [Planctomycetota bacterium]
VWAGQVLNWAAADRALAFTGTTPYSGNPGQATITSSLYLLIKYAEVTPKSFICNGELTATVFKASDYIADFEDEDAWDFGPCDPSTNRHPTNHCSYSYHMPYNQYFLSTASSEPGMAVAADRNPFLDPFTYSDNFVWNDYNPAPAPYSDLKIYQLGNAAAHQREGQNVLYMDIHVDFEKQSFCAIDDDNIYTSWSIGTGIPIMQGVIPPCDVYDMSKPWYLTDSLLVNECGYSHTTTTGTTPPPPTTAPPPPPPP